VIDESVGFNLARIVASWNWNAWLVSCRKWECQS